MKHLKLTRAALGSDDIPTDEPYLATKPAIVRRLLPLLVGGAAAITGGCGDSPSNSAHSHGASGSPQAMQAPVTATPAEVSNNRLRECRDRYTHANVSSDVATDFGRGEVRFYGGNADEGFYFAIGLKGCQMQRAGSRSDVLGGYRDLTQGRGDLQFECGMATSNYSAAYNQEMLRRHPETATPNCSGGKVSVDTSFPFSDIEKYRENKEREYGR